MSVDKLVDSTQLDSDLTSVANAIRAKTGGSSQLAFPNDFVSAIGDIPTGGTLITKTITKNGTYSAEDDDADGYSEVTVNVPSGGGTVETGTFIATTADSLTIPVTSLHQFIAIWLDGWTIEQSLSSNPYGEYKKLSIFAISPDSTDVSSMRGMISGGISNYVGTAYNGYSERASQVGGGNANDLYFTSEQIKFTRLRVGGTNRTFVDGATYNWRAW